VKPIHARVTYDSDACAFHLVRLEGHVFVNRGEIEEVILAENDLVEIGMNGPQLRFRIAAEEGEACKPVHRMIQDARDVRQMTGLGAGRGRRPLQRPLHPRDLATQGLLPRRRRRGRVPRFLGAGWMGSHLDDSTEREMAGLREQSRKMAEDLESNVKRPRSPSIA
jgi:hypothetical protein